MSVNETAGKVTLTITRSGLYTGAVSVNVATVNGTAKAGVNYTAVSQTVNFAAGQNSQTVTIPIKNVGKLASPLSFSVMLTAGANVAIGSPATETVTIQSAVTAPLVTMGSVQTKKSKGKVTGVVINFSGAVNKSEAQSTGTYELIVANKSGSFTGNGTKMIKIKSAAYNSANDSVTLTPLAFGLGRKVELVVFGSGSHGLMDAEGRYIDGDHNGSAGGNAVAIISKTGVSVQAVPRGPLAHKLQRGRRK